MSVYERNDYYQEDEEGYEQFLADREEAFKEWCAGQDRRAETECTCADAGKCEYCVERAVERSEFLNDEARDRGL